MLLTISWRKIHMTTNYSHAGLKVHQTPKSRQTPQTEVREMKWSVYCCGLVASCCQLCGAGLKSCTQATTYQVKWLPPSSAVSSQVTAPPNMSLTTCIRRHSKKRHTCDGSCLPMQGPPKSPASVQSEKTLPTRSSKRGFKWDNAFPFWGVRARNLWLLRLVEATAEGP